MTPFQRERAAAFAVTAIAFTVILLPELHYVPIWDGRVYANCAIEAARSGMSMESLRCAGHPSQGYAALLALSQVLSFGNIAAIHITNLLLGLASLASIRVVLARVFPEPALARELDAVTFLCAVHPVVLSTLLQTNLDFGVYVFFLMALAAQLDARFGLAAVAGVFLCFSKETGVLAYLLITGLDVLFRLASAPGTLAERLRRLAPLWPLPIPVALFGAHVLWWNATHAAGAVWKQNWQTSTIEGFRFFDLHDPVFVSYAAGIFVVGFMWVPSTVIAADLLRAGIRMARRLPNRPVPGADARRLAYVGVLTFVLAYLLTSFRTWSNLRYFALLYPLLVLLFFAALLRLGAGARVRRAALAVTGALFLLAVYRSADPVSRAVYGTFSIGEREMYRMASITREYAGPGRDELVYNLQFTGYHWAQNALFHALQPSDSTAFATSRVARWNIWSQLDSASKDRTLRQQDVIVPRYWDEVDLRASPQRPRVVWFLEFSYQPYRDDALATLGSLYRETGVERASARGHVLVAHRLELISP